MSQLKCLDAFNQEKRGEIRNLMLECIDSLSSDYMKKLIIWVTMLLFLWLIPIYVVSADADENATSLIRQNGVTLRDVTVYSEPNSHGELEGTISRNTNLLITGRNGDYSRIEFNGLIGYVRSEDLTRTQQFGIALRVAQVHLETNVDTPIVATVGNGRRVNVRYQTKGWDHVRIDGVDGWVRSDYLDVENAKRPHRTLMQVNLRESPYVESQILRTMAYGTELYVLQHSNTGFSQIVILTDHEIIEGWVVRNQIEYYDRSTTLSSSVALRRNPDTTSHQYAMLDTGTPITILGRATNGENDFYRVVVRIGGTDRHAWILSDSAVPLSYPEEFGDNPLGNPLSRMTTTTQSGRINVPTPLRAGADRSYRRLKRLNRGTNIAIVNYSLEKDWVRIRVDGQLGYVRNEDIYLVSQGVMLVYDDLMRGPDNDSVPLKRIFMGQTMQVRAQSGDWFRVTIDGVTGYLRQEQVHVRPYEGNSGAPEYLDLPYYSPMFYVKSRTKNNKQQVENNTRRIKDLILIYIEYCS